MSAVDNQLLIDMHAGDADAARTLWECCAPRLLSYTRVLLKGDDAAAADVVQQVFLRILILDKQTLRDVADVLPWMLGVSRRRVIDVLRSRRRGTLRAVRLARAQSQSIEKGIVSADESVGIVLAAIATLPRRSAEVIMLRHTSGLTFEQMALALGCNHNTVAARYRRAMVHLQTLLAHNKNETSTVQRNQVRSNESPLTRPQASQNISQSKYTVTSQSESPMLAQPYRVSLP